MFINKVTVIGHNGFNICFQLGKVQTVLSLDSWPQMDRFIVNENIVVGEQNNSCWIRDSSEGQGAFSSKFPQKSNFQMPSVLQTIDLVTVLGELGGFLWFFIEKSSLET